MTQRYEYFVDTSVRIIDIPASVGMMELQGWRLSQMSQIGDDAYGYRCFLMIWERELPHRVAPGTITMNEASA